MLTEDPNSVAGCRCSLILMYNFNKRKLTISSLINIITKIIIHGLEAFGNEIIHTDKTVIIILIVSKINIFIRQYQNNIECTVGLLVKTVAMPLSPVLTIVR